MSTAEKRSLVTKLSEVMGEVERIAKNGRNDFHKYDYATESDITSAVRALMAARHLMLVPSVEKTEWEKIVRAKGGETKLCTITVNYTLHDGDSGEEMKFTILGQGEDSSDKATYKAMTGATKYALMKLFLIPTGDDPEKDGEHRYTPPQGQRPSTQLTTAPAQSSGQPSTSEPIRDKSTQVKFGRTKGKYLCDIETDDLTWQLTAATKAVEANDPKWGESNKKWMAIIQAEAARRINGTSPPKEPAPATLGSWQKIVELGALFGKTETEMKSFCKTVLAGKKTVGPEDVRAVQEALGRVAKPLAADELPLYPGVE